MVHQTFRAQSVVLSVNGAKLLKPALILNAKCLSWPDSDRSQIKKEYDFSDIQFLQWYMVNNHVRATIQETFAADTDFVGAFEGLYPQTRTPWRAIVLSGSM